jgi:C_GCAxxG_C_C family probable redox protein
MGMDKSTEAVETFSKKYNCAQSVLSVFSEELNISKSDCFKIATPFGSGIAFRQEMCGAVTGALMAIGLKYGMDASGTTDQKSYTYDLTTHFISEFKKKHGSICCRDLLNGIDMSTPEGYSKVRELNLFRTHCSEYVRSAVLISEKILFYNSTNLEK